MKTFVDQQSFTAWLDSLYHKDTKEKHFIKVRDQSVDTNTVLGRYLSCPNRVELKQLLPEPYKNSDPRTVGELNAIKYIQKSCTPEQRAFAIKMDDIREHYSWWDREVEKLTREGYGYSYFYKIANRADGFINYLKLQYLRIRPFELNDAIVSTPGGYGIKQLTENPRTGSYPSGHAFDAWLFAYHLIERHPEHTEMWKAMAERIAESRMIVGVHFPSDNYAGHTAALLARDIDREWVVQAVS